LEFRVQGFGVRICPRPLYESSSIVWRKYPNGSSMITLSVQGVGVRGTTLIRKRTPEEPYHRPMPDLQRSGSGD